MHESPQVKQQELEYLPVNQPQVWCSELALCNCIDPILCGCTDSILCNCTYLILLSHHESPSLLHHHHQSPGNVVTNLEHVNNILHESPWVQQLELEYLPVNQPQVRCSEFAQCNCTDPILCGCTDSILCNCTDSILCNCTYLILLSHHESPSLLHPYHQAM